MNKKISFLILGSFAFIFSGCGTTVHTLVTAQYADRPVIIGSYWKKGEKIDRSENTGAPFESAIGNKIAVTSSQSGGVTTTYVTNLSSGKDAHGDKLGRDILMQNPGKNSIIIIDEIQIYSYDVELFFTNVHAAETVTKGRIAEKPKR
jgi:hypothetical protein